MATLPSLFVSHGSPDLLLHASPVREFFSQVGSRWPKPKAIVVVSAHWLTAVPTVSTAIVAEAQYDFWGFPQEAYQQTYRAPGAPEVAMAIVDRLHEQGFAATTHDQRPLDHGAWQPLALMYPQADISVTQLSVQPAQTPAEHIRLGQALAPLRDEGVLILGSGSATHNLRAFGTYGFDEDPPDWAKQFDDWLQATIATHQVEALLDYRQQAPFAQKNHPTPEHLLPLFVSLGAGGEQAQGELIHSSFIYGVFSMAAYAFHGAIVPQAKPAMAASHGLHP